MNIANKKVLIISHNPLSRFSNNGKTLVSIFKGLPDENIYQIYLNSDIPDYSDKCHYLQINENQIINTFLRGKNVCCQEVKPTTELKSHVSIKIGSFGIHCKRLLRELIWKNSFWKTKLKKVLEDTKFDVVFFMAGDGLFAYDVYNFVMKHTKSKGCLFLTDDYLIGRTSRSPIASVRQILLRRKVKNTLKNTSGFYVISEEMKSAYFSLFGIEGYVIRNFSVEKKDKLTDSKIRNNLVMVYAGGLHFSRWKVLSQVAKALKEINEKNDTKCMLKIYSSQIIDKDILNKISIDNASEFCGFASASEIAEIYANADVLLHVESFDKQAIESTKYSFSTKIPEYLSTEKCIVGIGPNEVASLKYLEKFACVVNDFEDIEEVLNKVINEIDFRNVIIENCKRQYEKDFSREKQLEGLKHILSGS